MKRRRELQNLVRAQGVERPFDILRHMPERSRLLLGQLLHCDLQPGESAEFQSWQLINQNLRGLQARTHSLPEQLSPFARNNNWWDIVTRTARHCGLRFYPGLNDEDVERLLFEHFAEQFVQQLDDDREQGLLAELHPTLEAAINSLGLSEAGRRALLATLLRGIGDGHADAREDMNRLRDWLRAALPWSWTTSVSQGLGLLQQRLHDICRAWIAQGTMSWARTNYGKVGTALVVIHLHALIEHTREQFELHGS